jgi:hypothetical protein
VIHLREHGICVNEESPFDRHRPAAQRIYSRDINDHVCVVAKALCLLGSWTVPSLIVRVVVGPVVTQAQTAERLPCERQAVGRIDVDDMLAGIIAGWVVVAVFQEEHLVTQCREAQDILQVMPGHASHGTADDVPQYHDPEFLGRALHC